MENNGQLIQAYLDTKRAGLELDALNVRQLVARLFLAQPRLPTEGEAYTFLARHQARLANAQAALRTAVQAVEAERDHALIHGFWTAERVASLPGAARQLADLALAMPVADYHRNLPNYPIDYIKRAFDRLPEMEDEAQKALRTAWETERKQRLNESRRAQVAAAIEAARQARLDKADETDLLADLNRPENVEQPYSFLSFFTESGKAVNGTLEALGLKSGQTLEIVGRETRLSGFSRAVEHLRAHPEDAFGLDYERTYAQYARHFAAKQASTDPADRLFLALPDGNLLSISGEERFGREAAFRLAVDTLGIDPRKDAAFVSKRKVSRYGAGYHYFYPTAAGHTCIISIPDREMRPEVWVCKGDLELAKHLLAERADPVIGDGPDEVSFEEFRKGRGLKPALAAATRNPFRRHPFCFERIAAHFSERCALEEARQQQ